MMDISYFMEDSRLMSQPITKPNRITGEGRMKLRGRDRVGDLKKKSRRKQTKKSRRINRR